MNKLKNFIISHQPYRVIGKSIRNIFFPYIAQKVEPSELFVELTSICNAKCVFCNYRFDYRHKNKMSISNYSNILQSGYDMGYRRLNLTPIGGELFVYEDAIEAIEIARNIGFTTIETYTNGILLHKYDLIRLLKSGITTLKISFGGFEKNIYNKVYGVNKFEEFCKSIIKLLEAHSESNSNVQVIFEPRTPQTTQQLISSDFYIQHIARFVSDKIYMNKPIVRYETWGGKY